jgi:GNAT superfamily N-acetyltransferase
MCTGPAVGEFIPEGTVQIFADLPGHGIVGHVLVFPADENGMMLVTRLWIFPHFRRRKLGTQLMRAAAEHAARRGCTIRYSIVPDAEEFSRSLASRG